MSEKMNIYQKMQKTIVELQSIDIKKSGSNNFAKFKYLELTDFLPELNKLLYINGLYCKFSFYENVATLKVYDVESNGLIEFETPVAEVKMKGVQEIQNLGAIHTYMRRYLYVLAFAICENDIIDAVSGSPTQQKQHQKIYDVKEQIINNDRVQELINAASNCDKKEVVNIIGSYGYEKSTQIKNKDLKKIIDEISKLPKKEG